MICQNLLNLTGFACQPINEQGTLARINTPFCFADGDPVPVYVQSFDNDVHRFFDDGQTVLHFIGRGMNFSSGHKLRFLSNLASKHGASLNAKGVIEILSTDSSSADAFARYISCLVAITHWEMEHQGVDADGSAFATEVAQALLQRYPGKELQLRPEYLGSSGKRHELDFKMEGSGYLAVKPTQQSAAPALYKLVDITNRQTNDGENIVVVIDDRFDKQAAKNTQQVFRSIVSDVIHFSKLVPADPASAAIVH
ncbi:MULTISPECIES: DUF1828 domain-containing protein [Delftia]|jgi:hypothetical protein|uniref:DUF1828 domain-containing protein n=3 Tax=Bacteria TaxID=2 RepID=A0ABN4SNT0_9BURK|nr:MULTISPECIES: DUF1828 domain-containing protein [Delftia]KEH12532.1 hypothetical protein GY15_20180 [Delftia sp. 670]AOV03609.1 hypothetical protein BI380_20775 [Delftia tsuruhatensis]MBS3720567.1 hypothetical protein [Delftia sp. PE138]MDH0851034.1 DUF1828 domain-containing protein [Delftia tsuruhatensis]MDH2232330.1 DUF1828 domain-containing protein [Delftia tsuruhatensis]